MKALAFEKCPRDCPKFKFTAGSPDPDQCAYAIGIVCDYHPGRTCPLPDIPIPHGTKRMQAIEWEKAWKFIQKLSSQGFLDNRGE